MDPPPVANQWWDPRNSFGGFHGCWARELLEGRRAPGTLATYQALSDALHRRGMYLIQDIVTNHTGNFFSYDGAYDPEHPGQRRPELAEQAVGLGADFAAPFDQNGGQRRREGHGITTGRRPSPTTPTRCRRRPTNPSDLDDLNTSNPVVRAALRASCSSWIRQVGVDGFRIDTAKFVEHDFWHDFVYGTDSAAPGMRTVAAETGRDHFLTFGEVFEVSDPMEDAGDVKATSYLGSEAVPELDAVLGFPMYDEIQRVFGGGRETSLMTYRLGKFMDRTLYRDPYVTPNFLDNHDVQRFLAQASRPAFEQALVFLFSIPGIPVVFQGTEQGFTETRASMFAAGWQSGGSDHFDTSSDLYKLVKSLSDVRRAHPAITRGDLAVIGDNSAGQGLLALKRTANGEKTVLALFNTADEEVLVSDLATSIAEGTRLTALATVRAGDPVNVGRGGKILAVLPARAALVLEQSPTVDTVPPPTVTITVDNVLEGQTFSDDVTLTGTVSPAATKLKLVLDGYPGRAALITPKADGTWTGKLAVSLFPYGEHPHTLVVYAPDAKEASATYHFTSNTTFDGVITTIDDPIGDDTGPGGTYTYPQDPTFAAGKSMDIEKVVVETGVTTLRLKMTMGETSTVWNPSNGFDHVSFNIYFDVPGVTGVTFLPQIQATAPADFAWDFTHFGFGWTNSQFKSEGASETVMGGPVPGRPAITVDQPSRTIVFEYDATKFGLTAWAGTKVYITTWDFDGVDAHYRAIAPEGGQWVMGGGQPTDPYIMDSVGPFTLPAAQ
ncbi:MAG: alpha-amylase family glycosyl hydrolase [Myxococcota bacterium]